MILRVAALACLFSIFYIPATFPSDICVESLKLHVSKNRPHYNPTLQQDPIIIDESTGISNQNETTTVPTGNYPTTVLPVLEITQLPQLPSENQLPSHSQNITTSSPDFNNSSPTVITSKPDVVTPPPTISIPPTTIPPTINIPPTTIPPSPTFNTSSPKPTIPLNFTITAHTVPPNTSIPTPSSTSTVSKTSRSHRNHTSAWEPFIHHYRALSNVESSTLLLFVVNFHEPHYEETDFILNKYFVEFRKRYIIDFDVVLIGPWENRKKTVKGNHLPLYGHYSYYSLAYVYYYLCIVESCSYHGFFYMNDDSYIDPRFLRNYDLTRSWIEPTNVYSSTDRWMWNKKINVKNVPFKQAFYNAVKELRALPAAKNCHFENGRNLRRGYGDSFYFILSDMPKWYEMILIMKKHYVFLELAAPTVNWCVTRNVLNDCNHGKMKNRKSCVHVHPVKYRKPNMKEYSLKRLDHLNLDEAPPRMY